MHFSCSRLIIQCSDSEATWRKQAGTRKVSPRILTALLRGVSKAVKSIFFFCSASSSCHNINTMISARVKTRLVRWHQKFLYLCCLLLHLLVAFHYGVSTTDHLFCDLHILFGINSVCRMPSLHTTMWPPVSNALASASPMASPGLGVLPKDSPTSMSSFYKRTRDQFWPCRSSFTSKLFFDTEMILTLSRV